MVYFIMLHAQLYFLFVFDFPEMVAPYLKCIFVWGSIKFLFLFLKLYSPFFAYRTLQRTRQVTRATHVRNRVCPRVELILKIILLIIFLGFIKSKPC